MSQNKESIGQFLKRWRERRELTQDDIARLTKHKGKGKWTKAYVSLVENDRPSRQGTPPRPTPEKLRSICAVLDAPIEAAFELAYGAPEKTPPERAEDDEGTYWPQEYFYYEQQLTSEERKTRSRYLRELALSEVKRMAEEEARERREGEKAGES